jgi:hypothetical protein
MYMDLPMLCAVWSSVHCRTYPLPSFICRPKSMFTEKEKHDFLEPSIRDRESICLVRTPEHTSSVRGEPNFSRHGTLFLFWWKRNKDGPVHAVPATRMAVLETPKKHMKNIVHIHLKAVITHQPWRLISFLHGCLACWWLHCMHMHVAEWMNVMTYVHW